MPTVMDVHVQQHTKYVSSLKHVKLERLVRISINLHCINIIKQ